MSLRSKECPGNRTYMICWGHRRGTALVVSVSLCRSFDRPASVSILEQLRKSPVSLRHPTIIVAVSVS